MCLDLLQDCHQMSPRRAVISSGKVEWGSWSRSLTWKLEGHVALLIKVWIGCYLDRSASELTGWEVPSFRGTELRSGELMKITVFLTSPMKWAYIFFSLFHVSKQATMPGPYSNMGGWYRGCYPRGTLSKCPWRNTSPQMFRAEKTTGHTRNMTHLPEGKIFTQILSPCDYISVMRWILSDFLVSSVPNMVVLWSLFFLSYKGHNSG